MSQNLEIQTFGESPAQLCALQQQLFGQQNTALDNTGAEVDAVIQALTANANDMRNANVAPNADSYISELQTWMSSEKTQLTQSQASLQTRIKAANGGSSCPPITTLRPSTSGPSTTQRSTTQRSTTKPSSTQPSTTQPSTTQPSTTQPSTTQPSTTQPSTSEPTTPSCCVTTVETTFCNTYHFCDNATEYTYIRDPNDCGVYFACFPPLNNWQRRICNPGTQAVSYNNNTSFHCVDDPQNPCISAAQQTMNLTNNCAENQYIQIAVPGDCNSLYSCTTELKVQDCCLVGYEYTTADGFYCKDQESAPTDCDTISTVNP